MNLLSDNSLKVTDEGLDLAIRLPWYRALPLSTVEIKELRIDGQPIDAARMTIEINGKDFGLDMLQNLTNEYWFVLDSAILHIGYPGVSRGREFDVELTVVIYPPYIIGLSFPHQAKERMRAS